MKLLSPSQISPKGNQVLVHANTEPYLTPSGLISPNLPRYPNLGWVRSVGPNADPSLSPNQYVLLEADNEPFEGVPVDFFLIVAEGVDGMEKIALPIEEEPRLKELVNAARVNSDADSRVTVVDIFTDVTWTMMLSDIKHFELTHLPEPGWGLEYVHTHMLWLSEGLFYLIEDKRIEAIIHY